jgi:O-antigen ligase
VLPLIAPGIAAAVLILLLSAPQLVTTLDQRIFGTSGTEQNVQWRERAAESVLYGTEDDRVLGVGFGRETVFRFNGRDRTIEGDPHNGYIWLLAGGGLAALGAFLLVGATFFVDAVRRLRRAADQDARSVVVWALALSVVFLFNAAAEPLLTDPTRLMTLWILIGLPSIVSIRDRTPAHEGSPR